MAESQNYTKYVSSCWICNEHSRSISNWDARFHCDVCDVEWRIAKSGNEYWINGVAWESKEAYDDYQARYPTREVQPPDQEPLLIL